jgi:hypothetical protein
VLNRRRICVVVVGVAAGLLAPATAMAGGEQTETYSLYRSQTQYYYEHTGTDATAHNEVEDQTGYNTTYFENFAGSIQCNGYGQSCITHAAARQYGTLYNGSYREIDAGNPYSFGHTYKACTSHKTQYPDSQYNWTSLDVCTVLTT